MTDTVVTLTAAPGASTVFGGWSGACSGTALTCTVTMSAAQSVTATFTPLYMLVATSVGALGSVTSNPPGIDCGGDCGEAYPAGTVVTLTASSPVNIFAYWEGACAGQGNPCTLVMTGPLSTNAVFTQTWLVGVSKNDGGTGTVVSSPAGIDCGADCSERYVDGTSLTLTATATGASVFGGWSGDCAGQPNPCTLSVTFAKSVTATFLPPSTLSVTKTGSGTVTSAPAGISCGTDCSELYPYGTPMTLTAAPAAGNAFASWGGACAGQPNPCTLTITANTSVSAAFAVARTLTVSKTGTGTGLVTSDDGGINCGADCSQVYPNGRVVTLTATPTDGSTFRNWSGACSGSSPTCTVTMSANRSVTARFRR